MTDRPAAPSDARPPERSVAREKFGRWPGVVWAVPLAAIIVVGYLALRAFAGRGVDVVVTFASAAGAQVGDTKVVYKGTEVGRVTKIVVSKDAAHVDMTLRLTPRAKPALRTGTQFWLVGANPSLTDVASLKAAVSGVSIGIAPGPGEPARRFRGLDRPPPVPIGTPGRQYQLSAEQVGSMRAGANVFYHGLDVGKVATIDLAGPQMFKIAIFLDAPYDRLVREDSLFWSASPVQISFSGSGVSTQFAPSNAALVGGVEFDTPARFADEPQSPVDHQFILYPDSGRAVAGDRGPHVLYDLRFSGSTGDLEPGAAVKLAGRLIGSVDSVGFSIDGRTGAISQPVTLAIQPLRMHLTGLSTPPPGGDWSGVTNAALDALLARGYRMRLVQSPPLIGPKSVEFAQVPSMTPGALAFGRGEHPLLPTATSADAETIADKATAILDKVNAVPLKEIGDNVRRLTANLNQLTGSPKVKDSLDHLDSTLNQVDAMVRQVKPQVGPLVVKLNTAADQLNQTAAAANAVLSGDGAAQDASLPGAVRELTDAARSIRSLTDYLGRHPEAVIRGKVKERP